MTCASHIVILTVFRHTEDPDDWDSVCALASELGEHVIQSGDRDRRVVIDGHDPDLLHPDVDGDERRLHQMHWFCFLIARQIID